MKKLGFGAMRLPLLNNEDKKSIDIETLCKMVDKFIEAGFTYFDTAFPYHEQLSENALNEALVKRYDRESYIFADKMPTVLVKSADDYPMYFYEQLRKTGVGYFDYYLMHNMGKDRYDKTKEFKGFEFAMQMKEKGLIKNFGFSFHDDADTLERILTEHPEVDFVQLQINYLDWNNPIIQSQKCYETACRYGKPVIVMEPVKGGTLANLPPKALDLVYNYALNDKNIKDKIAGMSKQAVAASYALRYAASFDNVMMVLSGMSDFAQMNSNCAVFDGFIPLNDDDRAMLDKVVQIINECIEIPCTSCGYCMEVCPKNISIPQLFGLYNNYKINNNFSNMYHQRITYNKGKSSDCLNCHRCEKNCPQHIRIPEFLKKIAEFEK